MFALFPFLLRNFISSLAKNLLYTHKFVARILSSERSLSILRGNSKKLNFVTCDVTQL